MVKSSSRKMKSRTLHGPRIDPALTLNLALHHLPNSPQRPGGGQEFIDRQAGNRVLILRRQTIFRSEAENDDFLFAHEAERVEAVVFGREHAVESAIVEWFQAVASRIEDSRGVASPGFQQVAPFDAQSFGQRIEHEPMVI